MLLPQIEIPAGLINGSNTMFQTAFEYQQNSLFVFVNASLLPSNQVTQISNVLGTFQVSNPPLSGSSILVHYISNQEPFYGVIADQIEIIVEDEDIIFVEMKEC